MNLQPLEPGELWRHFAAICAIPHPSGHESRLREAIIRQAEQAGLPARIDEAGNLRLDRPAAAGLKNRPRIILQAHLDMVPQKNTGFEFDFLTDAVQPRIEDGRVTAAGTTLGADNGLGLAAALALLLDRQLVCGPLALLATVEEETGLAGALRCDPVLLNGDILLNLDSETEGELYLGCAGGGRLTGRIPLRFEPPPEQHTGGYLVLRGLKGGHSGVDIDRRRGNAVKMLLELLVRFPAIRLAELNGGTLDNAIPREVGCRFALPPVQWRELQQQLPRQTELRRLEIEAGPDFQLELVPAPTPPEVWTPATQDAILKLLRAIPAGVVSRRSDPDAVVSSNNLGVVRTDRTELSLLCLARSSDNAERDAILERLRQLITTAGGNAAVSGVYPGWLTSPAAPAVRSACRCYRKLFRREAELKVIHAGLECGIFSEKNPRLAILSFGPTICDPHSPSESVEIASVERFYRFLRRLVLEIEQ